MLLTWRFGALVRGAVRAASASACASLDVHPLFAQACGDGAQAAADLRCIGGAGVGVREATIASRL